ncbi:Torsin-1B [Chamberlinius hualienensis]
MGIGIGLGAASLYAGFDYIKGRLMETCNEFWIRPNMTDLSEKLKNHLHGQHVVEDLVLKAVKAHFKKTVPTKPLVMSFHGWTGGGKNFVSNLITDSIFAKGAQSQFVHWFISTVHFPHQQHVKEYRDNLQNWIKGNVSICPLSVFIFDEVDKMPSGVLDAIKPLLDYFDVIDGVDYRKSIFIFLSNTGGSDITRKMLEFWSIGKMRESITYLDFEDIIRKGAFNEEGGLFQATVIDKNLIDYYVPFLPLEKKHVRLCVMDELKTREINFAHSKTKIEEIINEMPYFPEDTQLFSKTGCKRVAQKVDYHFD